MLIMGNYQSSNVETFIDANQKIIIKLDNKIFNKFCTDIMTSVQQDLTQSQYNLVSNQTGIFINNAAISGNLNISNVNINSNNIIDINTTLDTNFKNQFITNVVSEISNFTESVLSQEITTALKDILQDKTNISADSFALPQSNSNTTYQTYLINSDFISEISNIMENEIKNTLTTNLEISVNQDIINEQINESGIFLDNISVGGDLNITGGTITSINKVNSKIINKLNLSNALINSVESVTESTIMIEEVLNSLTSIDSEKDIAPTISGNFNSFFNTVADFFKIPSKFVGLLIGGIVIVVAILAYTLIQLVKIIFQPDVLGSIEKLVPTVAGAVTGKGYLNNNLNENLNQNLNHNMMLLKINDLLNLNEITEKFSCYNF